MTQMVMLSDAAGQAGEALPALELLGHRVAMLGLGAGIDQVEREDPELVLVDARDTVLQARNAAQLLRAHRPDLPLLAILTEGALAAITAQWPVDDFLLPGAGPAEIEARCRLLVTAETGEVRGPRPSSGRGDGGTRAEPEGQTRCGAVVIDEAGYVAKLDGSPLNLTYKEFELLKFLAQNPGRVFTRAQLLSEVWGYDYYGGTRTVDVHVRRLRSKLGADHEQMISTVRNVGYSMAPARS